MTEVGFTATIFNAKSSHVNNLLRRTPSKMADGNSHWYDLVTETLWVVCPISVPANHDLCEWMCQTVRSVQESSQGSWCVEASKTTACGVSGDQWEVLPFPHPHSRGAKQSAGPPRMDMPLVGFLGAEDIKQSMRCMQFMSLGVTWQWLTPSNPPTPGWQNELTKSCELWAVEPRALYTSMGIKQGTSSMTQESWGRLPPKTTVEASGNPPSRRAFFYNVAELDRSRRELRATLLMQCNPGTTQKVVSLNSAVATCTPNMLYLLWGVI